MSGLRERYLEVIALAQIYLLSNHEADAHITCEPSAYVHFKSLIPHDTVARVPKRHSEPSKASIVQPITPPAPKTNTPPPPNQPAVARIEKPKIVKTAQTQLTAPPQASNKRPLANSPQSPPVLEVAAERRLLEITPLPPAPAEDLADIQKLVATIAPQLLIVEAVPTADVASDVPVNAVAVIVTPMTTSVQARVLIQAVALAIQRHFGSCGVIHLDGKSAAPPSTKRIHIPNAFIYLQEPLRKIELWAHICAVLEVPQSQ